MNTKCNALDKKRKSLIFISYSEDMKVYQLIDPNTHDLFFHTHIQFDECLPNPSSSSPSSILTDTHDISSKVFYEEDIFKVVVPTATIDPPTPPSPAIATTPPFDVASSSTINSHMPKWAYPTLEDATSFIQDLHPSHHHSTGSNLVGQAYSSDS